MMEFQEGLRLLVALAILAFIPVLVSRASWSTYHPLAARGLDDEAERRAAGLLRDVLSEREQQQLTERGFLTIPSPSVASRVYRISARGGTVEVYESGKLVEMLCVQPVKPLPVADVVLMHKLMIEGNEQEYRRRANVIPAATGPRGWF